MFPLEPGQSLGVVKRSFYFTLSCSAPESGLILSMGVPTTELRATSCDLSNEFNCRSFVGVIS